MIRHKLRVAIVGAGIGGLTLGLLLRQRGVQAQIYEQASALGEVGAAVALAANGTKVLRRLGLFNDLAKVAVEPTEAIYRHWASGEAVIKFPMRSVYNERYRAEYLGLHRRHLQKILADAWGSEGLHLNARLQDLAEKDEQVRLHFTDGRTADADLVVGADGVHSTVRGWITGGDPAPVYSGTSGFRGLVQMNELRQMADPYAFQLWMGPGTHIVHYAISGDIINFLVVVTGPTDWLNDTWMVNDEPGSLLKALEGWHPAIMEMVAAVEQSPRWALFSLPPIQQWSRGRVTLLGDAVHAMLPHQGQGANQSIEDAEVLAALLARTNSSALATALRRYEVLRRPRTRQIQRSSWVNDAIFHLPDGIEAEKRNNRFASLPEQLDWIHGYDVGDVAHRAINQS